MEQMEIEFAKIMMIIKHQDNHPKHRTALRRIIRNFVQRWKNSPDFIAFNYYWADMTEKFVKLLTTFQEDEKF
jgi:hypothetical protein